MSTNASDPVDDDAALNAAANAEGSIEHTAAALDEALARISALPEESRDAAQAGFDALNRLHRDALITMVRALRADDRGRQLLFELVDDPGVRMVLGLHGIIRPDPATVTRQTLESLQAGLAELGVLAELVELGDAVVTIRLSGPGAKGCSGTSSVIKEQLTEALLAGVPGLRRVEYASPPAEPTLITLDSIGRRPA